MTTCAALLLTGLLTAGTAAAAEVDISKLPPPSAKKGLTYEKDIRPLFEASCFGCHSASRPRPSAGLRLDTLELTLQGSRERKILTPGDSAKSPLVIAISRLDPESAMPRPLRPRRGGPGQGNPQNPPAAQPQGQGDAGGANPPQPKNLTPEEVGLVRAWIDQGAK